MGICINGFLYYGVWILIDIRMIVCFDVRLQKLSFIKLFRKQSIIWGGILILMNYKGKLVNVIVCSYYDDIYYVFDLWVLEDVNEY